MKESTIIWQTGEPTISGSYLITIKEDFVTCGNYSTIKGWSPWNDEEITAWCRLKEIKPYKKQ